jgi:TatD DNase family protein
MLVETDAPFLAPVPHRGKRNEPAWVVETLGVLSTVTGVSASALAERIVGNFAAFAGSRA